MFKWLVKVLGSGYGPVAKDAADNAATSPSVPPADKAAPATPKPAREEERPLTAPQIVIEDNEPDDANGIVARHAIINREYRLVGYEFTMRDRGRVSSSIDAQSQKINDKLLIRAIVSTGVDKLAKSRQLWVSVVDAFIVSPMIESLPAAATVVVVRIPGHGGSVDPNLLARARDLRKAGYRLALTNWSETPAHQAWLETVDYLVIDTTAYNPAEVGELAHIVGQKTAALQVMARHIESFEEFEFCHRARYQLFQGNFLTKRENWPPQPKMSPDRIRLCELLNRLRAGDEIADIAMQLRHSPELSYRLLRYINSAAMGLQSRLASIERGLVFLGREKLYRWLTLLLFNADDTKSTDAALLEQALVRGRMMEVLASDNFSRVQCDEMFVVGIFSLLDVLLKLPLSVALHPLQLPPAVAGALLDDSGKYAPYLRLAIACEEHDEEAMTTAATTLDLAVDRVNAAHFEALAWAQDALAPDSGEAMSA